jgi:antagonist of KipI
MIRVLKPGLLTSVMDLGRPGHQRHGVVVGGALDRFAARVANVIVGNDEGAALLEIAQLGPELEFTSTTLVAWCGGGFEPRLGGEALPRDRAVRVEAGEKIWFGPAKGGCRAWLAVAGGIDVPLVLGSRSTYRRAGFGGFGGRPLQAGDELKLGAPTEFAQSRLRAPARTSPWTVRPDTLGRAPAAGAVRAMPGPEWERFTPEARQRFFAATWKVTKDADRMGVRLAGPELPLADEREMISEGVNEGVVQVPAGGAPIVLLASRQTVGGYPRIAAVASIDLGRLAQLAPGASLNFTPVTLLEAHGLWLGRERDFVRVRMGLARLG